MGSLYRFQNLYISESSSFAPGVVDVNALGAGAVTAAKLGPINDIGRVASRSFIDFNQDSVLIYDQSAGVNKICPIAFVTGSL